MGQTALRPCIKTRVASLAALFVFLGSSGCSVNSAEKHYVQAEKLWTDGMYPASVAEFEKVTAKDPKGKLGLQALLRGGITQALFLNQYDSALRKFRVFTETSTDPALIWDVQKQIGEILFNKLEQYDQAEQQYQTLLQQRPDAPEAPEFMYRLARSEFFQWHFDDAGRNYADLARRFPQTLWGEKAAYEIGVTDFTRGGQAPSGAHGAAPDYYDLATDAFNRFIRAYPQSPLVPQAKFGIANCLEEEDKLDAAYTAYEQLKTEFPSPNVIEIKLARIRERKAQRSH